MAQTGYFVDNVNMIRNSVDIVNKAPDAAEDESVLELVHAVMHQFRVQQLRALQGPADGLTHMESKVLGHLARRPGHTLRDLVEDIGRDKAQIARLIKGLRERGLIEGEGADNDRRQIRLQLTEEGRAITRAVRRQGRELESRALTGMSEAQRQRLMEALRHIRHNLDALDDTSGNGTRG